ncbi:MAG: hypothetical protein ACOYU3_07375 [Bacillota bacterium]
MINELEKALKEDKKRAAILLRVGMANVRLDELRLKKIDVAALNQSINEDIPFLVDKYDELKAENEHLRAERDAEEPGITFKGKSSTERFGRGIGMEKYAIHKCKDMPHDVWYMTCRGRAFVVPLPIDEESPIQRERFYRVSETDAKYCRYCGERLISGDPPGV